jgi:UDP-3-O-[3-hydroxymyristoyl] glucosamine N-acyltransferase
MGLESKDHKDQSLVLECDAKLIVSDLETDYKTEGDMRKIKGVASLDQATENDLSFCYWEGEKAISLISKSRAGIILCKKSMEGLVHPRSDAQLVFLDNPRLVFVNFANRIYSKRKVGISPRAVVSETARLGSNCYIGDFVVVGDNCVIGDNTTIYDRVSIVKDCIIGANCIVHQGVALAAESFAYERHSDGTLEKFPQLKGLRIGNNVEIGANSFIARGALTDTVIGDGTKIDAMVHVGHNVMIGRNCQLTAGTIVAGSCRLGDSCWTGINSTIKHKVSIGNNVIVGAGACVIRDVPDGDVVAGVPAKSIKHKVSTEELFIMSGQQG